MAINLSTLAPITTSANALSNLVLVIPNTLGALGLTKRTPQNTQGYQPQNPVGSTTKSTAQQPPAFMFHYEGEQMVDCSADITDHWVEDNTTVQDQIAIKPPIVTTHGFIGELNNVPPAALAALQQAANALGAVSSYTPALSATALIAYTEAFAAYQLANNVINNATSAFSSLSGGNGENVVSSNGLGNAFNPATGSVTGNQNKQQTAFQFFLGYYNARTLFTVQTPWAVFQNMAIQSLKPVQDASTRMITEFQIVFKQIRFTVSVTQTNGVAAILDGRLANMASNTVDFGQQAPNPTSATASQLATSISSGGAI